jgi:hypothetical protein
MVDTGAVKGAIDMRNKHAAPDGGAFFDPIMEARVSRLEAEMRGVKATTAELVENNCRIWPPLAVAPRSPAAETAFAEAPERTYMWGDLRSE